MGKVNLLTHEITVLNSANFVCSKTGKCCRQFTIPVTEEEISRIENKGYDTYQFIDEMTPALIPNKTGRGLVKIYFLKKKPFTSECVFLDGYMCKIHDFKPLACRLYPFQYDLKDGELIVGIHPNNICDNIAISPGKSKEGELTVRTIYNIVINELSGVQ